MIKVWWFIFIIILSCCILYGFTAKISRLAGEKSIWIWNDQTKKITEQIKKLCQNLPKLTIPTTNNVKWIIYTDASENYWGAALYHENNEGKEMITKYSSGK